jgi:CheY-like chemotaxis protein
VLLVEGDRQLATMLEEVLTGEGYVVDVARDGQRGLHLGLTRTYDLVVLDRGLPAIEGLDLLARLRGRGVTTPTPVLSALGNPADRVAGLADQGGAEQPRQLAGRRQGPARRRPHGGRGARPPEEQDRERPADDGEPDDGTATRPTTRGARRQDPGRGGARRRGPAGCDEDAHGADRRARISEQSQNGTPSRPPPPLPCATRPR